MTLANFVELIRERVAQVGLENPCIVAWEISRKYESKVKLADAAFDAIYDYAGAYMNKGV